jgi:hypothetical protein
MWVWLDKQGRVDVVVDAEFASLSRDIMLNTWRAPDLPPVHWAIVKPPALRPATAAPRLAAPLVEKKPAAAAPVATKVVVNTPTSNRKVGVYSPCLAIRLVLQTKIPAPFANNIIPCLNWHVRGNCTACCKYKEDHREHSAAEAAYLVSYLAEVAALQAANPSV